MSCKMSEEEFYMIYESMKCCGNCSKNRLCITMLLVDAEDLHCGKHLDVDWKFWDWNEGHTKFYTIEDYRKGLK